MRYALIGCGRISPNHIAAAQANGLDIVAVSDLIPERMEALSSRFGLTDTARYVDHRAMLEHEAIDLVAVCTESGSHGAVALDVLESKRHVIIEKPIALSLDDARAIEAAADRRGLVASTCHQNRFNLSIQKIRQALEAGRFGRLFYGTAHVRWNRGPAYYEQAPWRGTWAQDGGCLMNQCIHNVDLLLWMMGEAVAVEAMTDRLNHTIEAEDLGLAIVRFKNGAYGLIEGTTNVYPKNLEETLYLFGETGTVKAGGKSVNVIEAWSFADGLDDPEEVMAQHHENPPSVYGFGHTPYYRDVIEAITKGRSPAITAADGRRALELILAIYRASATQKRVELPLETADTLECVGLFDR